MPNNEMLSGIAQGGPRHGVKIDAPPSWNGLVKKSSRTNVQPDKIQPYPGRYYWNSREKIWFWVPDN